VPISPADSRTLIMSLTQLTVGGLDELVRDRVGPDRARP